MKIFGLHITRKQQPQVRPTADREVAYSNVYAISFDGEKNLGEIGPIKKYVVDYNGLRLRSWQAYLDSEVAQTIISRKTVWVIGSGLKLQCEPQTAVLDGEKIKIDTEEFNYRAESRFRVYADSTMSSYSGMQTLHQIAADAYKNSIVGGDVLVVLRYEDGIVKVELIDGAHVQSPINLRYNGKYYVAENGNRIIDGIEVDKRGTHIAYHVATDVYGKYERIPARGERSGHLMAYMVYGLKYRLNNMRGIPLISAVMETAKKMERYKEATVGSAEERQKIPYTIEHGVNSTEENPLVSRIASAFNADKPTDIPTDVDGQKLANKVAATTNKTTINMPRDSKLVALESKNELSFKDFYLTLVDAACATVGIPPNVAMSKYDSNFSASRAALKDWEHTIAVDRKNFAKQFYKPIYDLWLHVQILENKIDAPGYLTAVRTGNRMAIEAYSSARWVGPSVPHIDPVKEVEAERRKLGSMAGSIPLTTVEAATEALSGGDAYSNMEQFSEEIKEAQRLNIEVGVHTTPGRRGSVTPSQETS